MSNFPCSPVTRNITSHSMKNLAFHSSKDDFTTNPHYVTCTFLFKRLGECTYLGVKGLMNRIQHEGHGSNFV